ncbi:MAG TPA: hypothetical protein VM935_12365, partial [Chitinophagaceae bacterium]|nr:hypothetical protein [Chitinophagaceae bacterium]
FTRNDGTAGASLSMRTREVQLLGRKGDNNAGAGGYNNEASSSRQDVPASAGIDDGIADDLPF